MNSDERQRGAMWDAMSRWLAYQSIRSLGGRGASQRDALALMPLTTIGLS